MEPPALVVFNFLVPKGGPVGLLDNLENMAEAKVAGSNPAAGGV